MKNRKRIIDCGDFTITMRELLASISIVAIMLLIGFMISEKISDHYVAANEKYNKAAKVESQELFRYGMDTNVGNAFVFGELAAVDTVTYPEIGGEYMYVEKVKERYTMHTRTVTTAVNGKTCTRVETYWTWDAVGRDSVRCKEILFCGEKFNSGKIQLPAEEYIETIKESSHIRYKYYGVGVIHTGTIFADLRDGTIPDGTKFYKDLIVEETVESLGKSGRFWTVLFWIAWVALTGFCLYWFYYLDNDWLEN